MRRIRVSDFELTNKADRLYFIDALLVRWPSLWKNLATQVWNTKDRPNLKEWARLQGRGVYDDWLIEVFLETLYFWDAFPDWADFIVDPDSGLPDNGLPAAKFLAISGAKRMLMSQDEPDFKPTFDNPSPLRNHDAMTLVQTLHVPSGMGGTRSEATLRMTP